MIDSEEDTPSLRDDLDFLNSAGLIEIVGVDSEGEWLYGLSPRSLELIDDSDDGDPYSVLSKLIDKANSENQNEE